MCSFELPISPCESLRARLICPLHHSLFSTVLPMSPSTQELPCLTRGIANLILQLHSLEYRRLSAMIPYCFPIPNFLSTVKASSVSFFPKSCRCHQQREISLLHCLFLPLSLTKFTRLELVLCQINIFLVNTEQML